MSLPPKNSAKQREHDRARILTLLLADDALTDSLLDPQGVQDAALRDQTSELTRLVNSLPAADVADALESLPPDERQVLWQQVDPERHGQILVEASETVWDSLISGMSDKALLHALRTLDIDDPDQCIRLFRSNNIVGWLIFLGLIGGGLWVALKPYF